MEPRNASVARCLDVLEHLAKLQDGEPLSAIAATLGLPRSATHRLLSQLVERGYVRQDPASQHYRLSLRLTILGFHFLATTGLQDVCQPVLDTLAEKTGEHVRLAIVEGEALTWVAKAQGSHWGLRYDPKMGGEVVLYRTANGKAWLAELSDEDALRIVFNHGFAPRADDGARAVRSVEDFLKALTRTRRNGYGLAVDEGGEPGITAVAAAIRVAERIVGTVSIAGPTFRLPAKVYRALAIDVRAAADELALRWPVQLHLGDYSELSEQRRASQHRSNTS